MLLRHRLPSAPVSRSPAAVTVPAHRYDLRRWTPVGVDDLVRLGRDADGGYVVSRRSVEATTGLVGLGIADDWSFEEHFAAQRPEMSVVAMDGSVSAYMFRRRAAESFALGAGGLALLRWRYSKLQFAQAAHLRRAAHRFDEFFRRSNRSFRPSFIDDRDEGASMTWRTLCASEVALQQAISTPHLFMKMDIEGAEYRVLEDILADAGRISGMVVEFHDLDTHWQRFADLMDQMSKEFAVVHMHGNNAAPLIRGSTSPRLLEVSFANRTLLPPGLSATNRRYPLTDLDKPCAPSRPDHALAF